MHVAIHPESSLTPLLSLPMQDPKCSFCRRKEPVSFPEQCRDPGKGEQVAGFCPHPPEKPEVIRT